MRLLDLISQGHCATVRADDGAALPGAGDFQNELRRCPLRYVLSDELVRTATHLAYAEGDRLSACLDLIRVPARALWVEWADAPRQEILRGIPSLNTGLDFGIGRAGVLLQGASDCRSGTVRTFWSARDDRAYLSPVTTSFDFDGEPMPLGCADWRGAAVLTLPEEPAIDELLRHLRFNFDAGWSAHYAKRCPSPDVRSRVLHSNLSGCAFDMPMLMAFFLLLGARNMLPRREVSVEKLNRRRAYSGKQPLLEHIEVSAPLDEPRAATSSQPGEALRDSPCLHHVRGHLVRRGSSVFWRSPHMRGSGRFGQIRSRTVVLTFGNSPAPFGGGRAVSVTASP
jgi:hypothetical protein